MRSMLYIVLISLLSFTVHAQKTSTKTKHKASQHHTVIKPDTLKLPSWAAAQNYDAKEHLYFPDYYVYYDPVRGGYVFWENGKWSFSPSVPPYLEKVDLSKSRVQILKGLSLDLHPELNYPYYMKLYPANHNNDMVPVPGDH